MAKENRFKGGDNLKGVHKLYHEAMMKNELRDGKGAYELSYAEGKSGPSFGGNQMDISTNPDARTELAKIVSTAKDDNGNLFLNKADQDTIKQKLEKVNVDSKGYAESLQGAPSKVFGSDLAEKINTILSSDHGQQSIDNLYVKEINKGAKHVETIIDNIKHPAAKSFYDSDHGRVLLFDYHNQYTITPSGRDAKLVNFLNEGSTTTYTKKALSFDKEFTYEDHHKQFVLNTKQASNPKFQKNSQNRLSNIDNVLKQYGGSARSSDSYANVAFDSGSTMDAGYSTMSQARGTMSAEELNSLLNSKLHDLGYYKATQKLADESGKIINAPWRYERSDKEYEAKAGDTVWNIANNHGASVNQLLAVRGNEYLRSRRYSDDSGRDNIRINPGDRIAFPILENKPLLWHGNGVGGLPDLGLFSAFKNINNRNSEHGLFGVSSVDSFVSGDYKGFSGLHQSLLFPFSNWAQYAGGAGLESKLDSLKYLGFSKQYTTHAPGEYIFKSPEKVESFTDYAYVYAPTTFRKAQNLNFESYDYLHRQTHQVYSMQRNNAPAPGYASGYWTKWGSSRVAGATWTGYSGDSFTIGISFPIAIGLDEKISLVKYNESAVFFDFDDDGYYENTAWVGSKDTILVYDYNQNKVVDSDQKIVLTRWDKEATSDFDALKRKFDSNNDGSFDDKDAEFNKFYLWQDVDQDGASQESELTSLSAKGIKSITLNFEAPEEVLKKDFGVLNVAKVTWITGKTTYAYDVAFTHSTVGIRLGLVDEGVVLSYKNESSYKIYKSTNTDQAIDLKLESNDYDLVLGSSSSDKIELRGDHSVIVDSGDGDDVITTGAGNDWVKGGNGADSIQTGGGHDILFIDSQDKNINGGEGFDVAFVTSSEGIKIDLAATNIEAIYCNVGSDTVSANGANGVQIHANKGDDRIIGSDGDDILVGGLGKDAITGGGGNDKIFIDSEDDISEIDAGDGEDSVYVTGNTGISINLGSVNAENFFGSSGNDKVIAGDNKNYVLYGGEGNDELAGGKGSTILDGGPGNDILRGGSGNNRYMFSMNYGKDIVYPAGRNRGAFKDLVLLTSQIALENLLLERIGDDLRLSIKGNDSSLTIANWAKGDAYKVDGIIYKADDSDKGQYLIVYEDKEQLALKDGKDWIVFSFDSNDYIEAGTGSEFINSGGGNDNILNFGGSDTIYGGPGNDEILTLTHKDFVDYNLPGAYVGGSVKYYGGDGNDYLGGGDGDDLLDGGEGDDTLYGGLGNDRIFTGNGFDKVFGKDGNDEITITGCGLNADGITNEIRGGTGNDIFILDPPMDVTKRIMYSILDFELGNKNEKLDFSKISALVNSFHSLTDDNMGYIPNIEFSIDPESTDLRGGLLKVVEKATVKSGTGMCWFYDAATDIFHCVALAGFTIADIKGSPDNFIFG